MSINWDELKQKRNEIGCDTCEKKDCHCKLFKAGLEHPDIFAIERVGFHGMARIHPDTGETVGVDNIVSFFDKQGALIAYADAQLIKETAQKMEFIELMDSMPPELREMMLKKAAEEDGN